MADAQQLLQRKALLERKRELLIKKQQIQGQSQDTGPGLAFKRPSIPFTSPKGAMGVSNPMFAIQNLGAAAQRVEGAISGAGEEALSGRFKNIPSEFMKGLKGEKTTEYGDLFTRRNVPFTDKRFSPEAASTLGFGASMVDPFSLATTALTGGANKLLTPSLAKPVTKPISKIPGAIRNFLGGVEGKTIKDLRNIVDRLGVGNVFKSGAERKTFVGSELTPRVQSAVTKNVENLEPVALKELGLPDNLISEMQTRGTPQGLKLGDKIRHTVKSKIDEAGQEYEQARRSLPKGFKFDVKGLRGKVGGILRERGVIDEKGKLIRPIVDDPDQIKGLYRLWNELSDRVRLNRPGRIGGLLSEEETKIVGKITPEGTIKGSAKAGEFGTGKLPKEAQDEILRSLAMADELDSDQFFRNRLNLQGLLSGEKQFDRLVLQVIDVMDNAAESSGQKSLKNAVKSYRGAKEFEESVGNLASKADEKVEKFTKRTSIEGKLRSSQQEERVSLREELSNLIGGKQTSEILDMSQANKILTDPGIGGIGKPRDTGWLQTGRNIARRGIRRYEESVSPKLRDLVRRTQHLRRGARKGISVVEKGTLRKMIQGMSEKEEE